MATNLETKIGRIRNNVTAALAKIAEKGVTVPEGAGSDDLEGLIDAITGGGGGGALPTGIAKMNCGFITNTTPYTDVFEIEHGLGVKPDFAIITVTGDITEDFDTNAAYFGAVTKYTTPEGKGLGFFQVYFGSGFGTNVWNNTYTDETYFRISPSGIMLNPGTTYFWLAAVLDV